MMNLAEVYRLRRANLVSHSQHSAIEVLRAEFRHEKLEERPCSIQCGLEGAGLRG
jgi:hypothetical protein